MEQRKWSPRSFTIVSWLFVLALSVYLTNQHISWYMELFGVGKYSLMVAAVGNILIRLVTSQPIGKGGKKLHQSKTFWWNFAICIISAANLYWGIHTGQNIATPTINLIVAIWTIWLRIYRTKTRVTILPGFLGRLI